METGVIQKLVEKTSSFENGALKKNYCLYNGKNELIATVHQRSIDANIHRVNWYGGEMHGKSVLTEGGIDGMMDYTRSKIKY